jgi:hypothetical protein
MREGSMRSVGEECSHSCEVGHAYEGRDSRYSTEDDEAECSNQKNEKGKEQSREEKDDENERDEDLEERTVFNEILVRGEMNAATLADMYQRLSRHMLSLVDVEGDPIFPRALMRKQFALQKLKILCYVASK